MRNDPDSDLDDISLLELFREEAETQAAVMTAGLVSLERDSRAVEQIEPLMRAAHSIKGSALVLNLKRLASLAGAMEECFVEAQRGHLRLQPIHFDVLREGVDFWMQISQLTETEVENWDRQNQAKVEVFIQKLSSVRAAGDSSVPRHSASASKAAP
jgi:two-component system sensor histidine kinase and response regulator WspE